MNEQTIIHAEKALNTENMKEFLSLLVDDETTVALVNTDDTLDILIGTDVDHIRQMFEDDSVADKANNYERLSLIAIDSNVEIDFLKQDYFWYFKRPRRLTNLFSAEVKQKPVKRESNEVRLNIACGTKKDGQIVDIAYLCGNEKELVKFINEQYTERLLRSFFKDKIVFNIAYSSEEELNDENMWFTFDELKEGGIIEV